MDRPTDQFLPIVAVIALALFLRIGVAWWRFDSLENDPDAYRAIAEGLAEGRGFTSVTGAPTAFRPPLYPIVLAALLKLGGGKGAIAALHVALGTATVGLTLILASQLGLGAMRWLAGLLVAVDPLLLQYTTVVMTETMFTFLTAALLVCGMNASANWRWSVLTGFLFGLCALCRPTIWAFGGLLAIWWLLRKLRDRETGWREWAKKLVPLLAGVAVTVSPWLIRNLSIFGRPILTTTHGGYTLLLGNNPVFYREVVAQSWGTVWQKESLLRWQEDLEAELHAQSSTPADEVARDRWMYERAWHNIEAEPRFFVRACWQRFLRFWNIVPLGEAASGIPRMSKWGVGGYYFCVLVLFLVGLIDRRLVTEPQWTPLLLILIALTVCHLFYWSNTRMRAPLVPVIGVLAVNGVGKVLRGKQ